MHQPTKYTREQWGIDRTGRAPSGKCRGGWYLIVLRVVELGRGRELNKIDALIKLIIFLACAVN